MENSDESWQPPSEGELKIMQARRERQDRISKVMGQYLLKGYKMLDAVCPICQVPARTSAINLGLRSYFILIYFISLFLIGQDSIFVHSQTVLLRPKGSTEDYCVACSELDSDVAKDDPGDKSTLIYYYYFELI